VHRLEHGRIFTVRIQIGWTIPFDLVALVIWPLWVRASLLKKGEVMMNERRLALITRADDCGLNRSTNYAILEACEYGIARNVSLMAVCPEIEHAAELLAGRNDICFGLHVTLNAEWERLRWGPLLPVDNVPSLVQADGTLYETVAELEAHNPRPAEVLAEIQAQYDRLRILGFAVRYADVHMAADRAVQGFEAMFDDWCRSTGLINFRRLHQTIPGYKGGSEQPFEHLISCLGELEEGVYTLIGHPGYDSEETRQLNTKTMQGDAVARMRIRQRLLFTDRSIRQYCEYKGIVPIRYDEA
jgi:hypothetical protein